MQIMEKKNQICLLFVAFLLLKGTCMYAQDYLSDRYAWRLDSVVRIYDYGSKSKSALIDVFAYGDDNYSVRTSNAGYYVENDSLAKYLLQVKLGYTQIGANGAHKATKYYLDIFPIYNAFQNKEIDSLIFMQMVLEAPDSLLRPTEYELYQYDKRRPVYDNEGHLLREIRNYDYTQARATQFVDYIKPIWGDSARYVQLEDDDMSLLTTMRYDTVSEQWIAKNTTRKEYTNHHVSCTETTTMLTLPDKKAVPREIKTSWRNRLGIEWKNRTETRNYDAGELTTVSITMNTTLSGDSARQEKETTTYTTDSLGVAHTTATKEDRLYLKSIDQTIYAKKSVLSDGIERIENEEEWAIETTPQGKKAHLLYQDRIDYEHRGTYIYDSVIHASRYIEYNYTVAWETHKRCQYDDKYRLRYSCDSSQTLIDYLDTIVWEGVKYATSLKRPEWTNVSRKEYEFDEEGKVVHDKQYTGNFIDGWFLTKETLVTDDYTWSMTVNTKDTTRTISKKYANGWDSESTKEKLDTSSMKWEITESSKYVITFDMTGEPVSAVSASTSNNNTKTDRTYYLFHHWDETEQRYIRQEVAWSIYDITDPYSVETIHPFDCEDYTYYDRKGNCMGYFMNCVSHYLPITNQNVNGIYNKRHYDDQGRVDTLYRYAFYGEWYLVRYFVYEYFPEEGIAVVAKRHSYSLADSWEDWTIDSDDPTQNNFSDWRYYNLGLTWHKRLSGADTVSAPLHEMRFLGTKTYSHTYSTYNDDGVLLETRTYNNGSMMPVTQIHNTFAYDEDGRMSQHVAYKDSVPNTRKDYFYETGHMEPIATITWTNYNKESGKWEKCAFSNNGSMTYDTQGRLVKRVDYKMNADSTGAAPDKQYTYLYEVDETDWILMDSYVYVDGAWECSGSPTYRGNDLNLTVFDDDGNVVSQHTQVVSCGNVRSDAMVTTYTYGSPTEQYPVLSPIVYSFTDDALSEYEAGTHARVLQERFENGYPRDNYTATYYYTPLKSEIRIFNEPIEVEPEEETAFFTWPKVDGAAGYSLTIWADEAHTTKLCTIIFDARGTVLTIDFSRMPSHNYTRAAWLAETVPSVAIWQTEFAHLVENLESGTNYWYTFTAFDEKNRTLDTRSASFTTKGVKTPTNIDDAQSEDVQCIKVLRNGQIIIRRGDAEYSIQGNQLK